MAASRASRRRARCRCVSAAPHFRYEAGLPITPEVGSNRVRSLIEHIVVLTDEYRFKILRLLEARPEISQRELARELGVSLGRVNYCLQALANTGMIKAANFKNSNNKKAYVYCLTRKGLGEKARATVRFLNHKMAEYEALRREIESLQRDMRK